MPTTDYQKRTEQNVIGSDGTVIFSHGKLTGGSAYTEKMADEHDRPCLHLDLSKHDIFTLALTMINWIHEAEVATLNFDDLQVLILTGFFYSCKHGVSLN